VGCSGLQCVAVCCSGLQCVIQCVAVCYRVLQCVSLHTKMWIHLKRLLNATNLLQCVAVCCSVFVAPKESAQCDQIVLDANKLALCAAMCCNVLQCVAVCCSVLHLRRLLNATKLICTRTHVDTHTHTHTHTQCLLFARDFVRGVTHCAAGLVYLCVT